MNANAILLEQEQEDLLAKLIEANKSLARDKRTDFKYSPSATRRGAHSRAYLEQAIGEGGSILYHFFGVSSPITRKEDIPHNHDHDMIYHPGLPEGKLETIQSDLDALQLQNLISFRNEEHFFVTPQGEKHFLHIKSHVEQQTSEVVDAVSTGDNSEAADVDFAIITAIKIEREAICKVLGMTAQDRVFKGTRVYWRGRLLLNDTEFYEIVVVQCSDMGNIDAAILTNDAMHHWHPQAVLMVGIAGAASNEQKLGDVVVARDVHYYERGKQTPQGLKPEIKMIPSDAALWNRYQALPEWMPSISVPRPGRGKALPALRDGVIASGEKVIADEAVRDQIAHGDRKTQAIEMEGYGFSRAVWQNFEQVRHLVIRAVCDAATSQKNSKWHLYAAAAAADFAKFLLLDRPLEPRSIMSKKKL